MIYTVTRDRAELFATILEVVNGRKLNGSQIMYKSFVSYAQMKQYVSILIGAGLIKRYQEGNRKRTYGITDKGLRFLQLHNQLGELLLTTTNLFSSSPKPILH